MKRIPKRVWTLLLLLVVIYGAWNWVFPSGFWRYRMTVVVDTPEGTKSGSAVREVRAHSGFRLTPESVPDIRIRGEAVAVNLGKRGTLFALLTGDKNLGADYSTDIVFHAFPFTGPLTAAGIRHYQSLQAEKVALQRDWYPLLVRFGDVSQPATVQKIDPGYDGSSGIKTEAAFGKGVRLKEITIEMTHDDVTADLIQYLQWLPDKYNKAFSGRPFFGILGRDPLKDCLSSGSFSTGENINVR